MSISRCPNCGHAEYVHFMFVGHCTHGSLSPKDGKDCDCQSVLKARQVLEQVGETNCVHGVGHKDGVHGCDGCCLTGDSK